MAPPRDRARASDCQGGREVGGRRRQPDGSSSAALTWRCSRIDRLKSKSKKVTNNDEIAQVGTVSANAMLRSAR